MPAADSNIENWDRRHFNARTQAQVLSFLIERVDYYDSINFNIPFDKLYEQCEKECQVSKSTARRWWLHFELYGELPFETEEYMRRISKKYNFLSKSARLDHAELNQLKAILDNCPDLFLDEIAIVFGVQTGKFMHHVSLWRYITNTLGYSLQSLTESAAQQSEMTRDQFRVTLELMIHDKPEMLVMVDETHRDRNAARRRRT